MFRIQAPFSCAHDDANVKCYKPNHAKLGGRERRETKQLTKKQKERCKDTYKIDKENAHHLTTTTTER